MIAPVSPAEFLPARLEGVSSKHEDREVSPFEKSSMSWGEGWELWLSVVVGPVTPCMMDDCVNVRVGSRGRMDGWGDV